jgi:hypothetical protein
VDPGHAKVQVDKPKHSNILHPVQNSRSQDELAYFSIWLENVIEEMDEDLKTIFSHFGPLFNDSSKHIEPIRMDGHSYSANKGAYVNFVSYEDAVAALDAVKRRAVVWGRHRGVAIFLTAQPVGNTNFILKLLEELSDKKPSISFSRAAQLHDASGPPVGGAWLAALRRCPHLFSIDDSHRLIERPASPHLQPSPRVDSPPAAAAPAPCTPPTTEAKPQADSGAMELRPAHAYRPRCDGGLPLHSKQGPHGLRVP